MQVNIFSVVVHWSQDTHLVCKYQISGFTEVQHQSPWMFNTGKINVVLDTFNRRGLGIGVKKLWLLLSDKICNPNKNMLYFCENNWLQLFIFFSNQKKAWKLYTIVCFNHQWYSAYLFIHFFFHVLVGGRLTWGASVHFIKYHPATRRAVQCMMQVLVIFAQ